MRKKFKITGFTLVELLIVIAVIAILATVIFGGSIQSSFQKARDSKRKQDLNKMLRFVEDYYNDKEDYPTANDPTDGNIKGAAWGSPFTPYVAQLPLDPLSPNRDYYYQVNQGTKKFFVIYAKLENKSDLEIIRVGCQDGCGPIGPDGKRAYNYFVSSPNVVLLAGIPAGFDPGMLERAQPERKTGAPQRCARKDSTRQGYFAHPVPICRKSRRYLRGGRGQGLPAL